MKYYKSHRVYIFLFGLFMVAVFLFIRENNTAQVNHQVKNEPQGKIISGSFDKSKFKTDEEWKKLMTKDEFRVVREQGTETPFTGKLLSNKQKGTYYSVGCNTPVFRSDEKYESNTGWPSFWAPIDEKAVVLLEDNSYGTTRVEVTDVCGGHLGHVFDDGPEPTGKRYCINSLALKFVPDEE